MSPAHLNGIEVSKTQEHIDRVGVLGQSTGQDTYNLNHYSLVALCSVFISCYKVVLLFCLASRLAAQREVQPANGQPGSSPANSSPGGQWFEVRTHHTCGV